MMKRILTAFSIALSLLVATTVAATAQERARADIKCQPSAQTLVYTCAITLARAKGGEAISGADVMVGADMPSMPMAHNVKPAKATPTEVAGQYNATLTLEMHGDWAVHITVGGPLRDKIVNVLNFTPTAVAAAARTRPTSPGQPKHQH
jgi:hypothetical protein